MSIAVSATIHPSRVQMLAVVGMLIVIEACAFLLGADTALPLAMRTALSAVCAGTGLTAFLVFAVRRKAFRIDISGIGQIRLQEYRRGAAAALAGSGEVVQLLGDSTLWPWMLVLRLQSQQGRVTEVTVLPDSLSRDAFRSVCVACRWIAAHNDRPVVKRLE